MDPQRVVTHFLVFFSNFDKSIPITIDTSFTLNFLYSPRKQLEYCFMDTIKTCAITVQTPFVFKKIVINSHIFYCLTFMGILMIVSKGTKHQQKYSQ